MSRSFSTQSEAERAIAEQGKAGKLKPVHLPGRRWLLTTNREGKVSKSLFYHVVAVALEREGRHLAPREIHHIANEIWASARK